MSVSLCGKLLLKRSRPILSKAVCQCSVLFVHPFSLLQKRGIKLVGTEEAKGGLDKKVGPRPSVRKALFSLVFAYSRSTLHNDDRNICKTLFLSFLVKESKFNG